MSKQYFPITREMVANIAKELVASDANNTFTWILKQGQVFADAGMTPVYVVAEDLKEIRVFAQETHNKKLH